VSVCVSVEPQLHAAIWIQRITFAAETNAAAEANAAAA